MDWLRYFRRMLAGETLTGAELTQVRAGVMGALQDGADLPSDAAGAVTADDLVRGATLVTEQIERVNAEAASRATAREALQRAALAGNAGGQGAQGGQGGVQVLDRGDDPGAETRRDTEPEVSIRAAFATDEVRDAVQAFRAGGARGKLTLNVPGEVRALFATTNNPVRPTRLPGYVQNADQPTTILDLIDRQPISTNSVEWVQETTPPNAAAEVAEGAAKPEASFVLTLKQDTTATIAHFVNITRQTLDDDLQLRGYVEGRLSYGLMKRLAGQVLNGNGTAPNLRGILNTSGLGSYTAGSATEKAIVSIRKAKTVAQLSEYDPDTVVLNPVDLEAVDLTSDTTGAFIVAPQVQTGAVTTGTERVWGLRVVSTTAIPGSVVGTTGGTFLVGAMREGVTLWERTGVQLFITDSHASNFTSNILTLLAEMRAALSVWRPASIVKGTFGASRS